MKYSILFMLWAFIGCSKTNVTLKHYWKVQEGHDLTTWNHAAFCSASDYGVIDTVELDNTASYDSTKFGMREGTIYFFPKNGRIPTADPEIFERNYCKLLIQIN
jgi:hypothetical protein